MGWQYLIIWRVPIHGQHQQVGDESRCPSEESPAVDKFRTEMYYFITPEHQREHVLRGGVSHQAECVLLGASC